MKDHPRNLEELLQNDSFVRWIRGNADEQEKSFWENWLSHDNRALVEEAEKVLQAMQFKRVDTSDVEEELNKLNMSIDSGISAPEECGDDHRRNDNIFRYVAAAAVTLIIFTAGFFAFDWQYNSSSDQLAEVPVQTKIKEQVFKANAEKQPTQEDARKTNKISTGFAEKTTLVFDDGSKVVLNAKSSLEYPTGSTAQGDISVQLRGEAYFDIAERNEENKRTFSVRTENGSINVLGTKFAVQADDKQTEVALKEGVVELKPKRENTKYTMRPGELAKTSRLNSSIKVDKINPSVYFSWTQNQLHFDNTSLSKIIRRMEHTYGVNAIVADQSIMEKRISGSIQNNDLDVLLNALSKLLQIPIERNKNTITIGT